jgi:hypothetical protein
MQPSKLTCTLLSYSAPSELSCAAPYLLHILLCCSTPMLDLK